MSRTRVALLPDPGGGLPRLELGVDAAEPRGASRGMLRLRLLGIAPGGARVALVADGALLLRGDEIGVEVVVGAGMRLELVEPSGTVAYAMRGGSAEWAVEATVEAGGVLVWHGQPFVVAEGARVRRTTAVRLAEDASLLQRETLVFGRCGEGSGRLVAATRVTRGSRPVLVEELSVGGDAPVVGVLGPHRVMDTVLALGPAASRSGGGSGPGTGLEFVPDAAEAVRLYRLEGGGAMVRGLADASHRVSLTPLWRALSAT